MLGRPDTFDYPCLTSPLPVKNLLYFPAIAVVCGSCQKNDVVPAPCSGGHCTTTSGRFTTDDRTAPVAGLPLRLSWVKRISSFYADVRPIAETTTDAQGNYTLRFLLQDDELTHGYFQVSYVADKQKYIVDRDNVGAFWSKLTRDTTIVSNWLLPRKAFIHPEITNPTEIKGSYWAQYSFANGPYGYRGKFTYSTVFTFDGGLPTADIAVAANQPVDLQTDRMKDGKRIITHDTVRVAPGATYVHRVTY